MLSTLKSDRSAETDKKLLNQVQTLHTVFSNIEFEPVKKSPAKSKVVSSDKKDKEKKEKKEKKEVSKEKKETKKKREEKQDRKQVKFNEKIETRMIGEERTWNDFKKNKYRKGAFTEEEIMTLLNSLCSYVQGEGLSEEDLVKLVSSHDKDELKKGAWP